MGTQYEFIAASRREVIKTNFKLHFALNFPAKKNAHSQNATCSSMMANGVTAAENLHTSAPN